MQIRLDLSQMLAEIVKVTEMCLLFHCRLWFSRVCWGQGIIPLSRIFWNEIKWGYFPAWSRKWNWADLGISSLSADRFSPYVSKHVTLKIPFFKRRKLWEKKSSESASNLLIISVWHSRRNHDCAFLGFQWFYCEHVAGVFLSFLHDNIKCWLCAVAFLPLIVQYARLLLANEVTTEVPAHSSANRPGSNRSGEVIHPWAHLDRRREKCDDVWQDVGHHVTTVGISSTTASLVCLSGVIQSRNADGDVLFSF